MWPVIGLLAAALIAAYILIGYPLLLALFRGRSRPAVQKDLTFRAPVTVILSVFNGAAFLHKKLDSLLALDYPHDLIQILVVSDGSTDATETIVREYADRGVRLLVRPHLGKASALNAAFEHAEGEILFFTDVRQLLDRDSLQHLVANFADPTVGAVTGEMRLLPGKFGEQEDLGLYWRYELWVRRRHSDIDSLFNTTGCIYAMRRSLVPPLPADTLSDDAILPLAVFFRGYRVIFDPEAIALDYPAVPGTEFRRRWRNLAGLWQVHVRNPRLFSSKNRMRFHFLSHKFGRLVLPWALLAILLATAALPYPEWRKELLMSEGALLLLAVIDFWIPAGWPLKRLSSPARTFLLMNLASLVAVTVFFIQAQKLWKPTQVGRS
jgi:cellulose synthase/poly-beta-1,6-N-acetylglucosamine synthase-like glycosyltransferase